MRTSIGLLDVNVLVAILVEGHEHHAIVQQWLHTFGIRDGWATCALTELSTVRVCALTPKYAVEPRRTARLIRLLRHREPRHVWWADSPCVVQEVSETPIDKVKHHLTDMYLLGLARRQRARLITFDRKLAAAGNAEGRMDVHCLLPKEDSPAPSS